MTRLFGLPVLAAIVAGILFPYTAITLMPIGFVFLAVLMLLSGFSIEWGRLAAVIRRPLELFIGLFLLFVLFPLLQFFVARMLIDDSQYLVGAVFASLMPAALVVPFFTGVVDGDEELSFLLLVVSMLIAPFVSPLLLQKMTASVLPIQIAPLFKSMFLLVSVPLFLSFLISRFIPALRRRLAPYLGIGNSVTLGILIFIFFGTAVGRMNVGYESATVIVRLLLLAFIQDFGVLYLGRVIVARLFSVRSANAMMVSLSMKNVAIAAGILLFYDPRASLAPAMVFIAHACLFSFIPMMKKRLAIPA